jgi:hypothetical protein
MTFQGSKESVDALPFHIFYIDPKDNDLLPITNTDNYRRALQSARPLLRLVIQVRSFSLFVLRTA